MRLRIALTVAAFALTGAACSDDGDDTATTPTTESLAERTADYRATMAKTTDIDPDKLVALANNACESLRLGERYQRIVDSVVADANQGGLSVRLTIQLKVAVESGVEAICPDQAYKLPD